MIISDAGLAKLRDREGCRLAAYPDPATGGDPWTIGVGHTGPEVVPGMVITESQADQYLREDCADAEDCISEHIDVDLTQNQHDALVSLIFNIGCGNFRGSTLRKMINAGNFDAAAGQFCRWNRAAGKVMAGLTNRRKSEAEQFVA